MAVEISAGKLRGLRTLADEEGRLKMLAIDQRGSLNKALEKALGREATFDEVASFKQLVTECLAPYSTAVLTDPVYGYARSLERIPGDVGLLLAYEATGYSDEPGSGRKTTLIEGWSVAKARRAGATAIKLLLYYHPDAGVDVLTHQHDLCRAVGEECVEHDLPFLLETVAYSLEGSSTDTPEFARQKPELVCRSAEEFSDPQYHVDILKLEFPADLKYTREFRHALFDDRERPEIYTLHQVQRFCEQLNDAAQRPWVILSAGVDIQEFLANLDLACDAGASGFLCGRAIWKEAIPLFTAPEAVAEFLDSHAAINFLKCNAAAERALPLWKHRALVDAVVAADTPDWYRAYEAGGPALFDAAGSRLSAAEPVFAERPQPGQ